MKKKILKAGPIILLGGSFLLLLFLNLFCHDHWLDSDMAAEMIFSRLLAKEGHFFATPNWYYSTEFRFLYTHWIMKPLFLLMSDWHLIRALTNLLSYVLMLAAYFYLMEPLHVRRELVVLSSAILLLPFSETMMMHMVMGNTYLFHIIIVFWVAGLFLRLVEEERAAGKPEKSKAADKATGKAIDKAAAKATEKATDKTENKTAGKPEKGRAAEQGKKAAGLLRVALYLVLSVICGVSGVRYLLALQCPLVLTAFLYLILSPQFQKFRREMSWEHPANGLQEIFSGSAVKYFAVSLLGLLGSVAGYGINVLYVSRKYVFQTYDATNFIAVYQGIFLERVQNALGSLLMLFGYIPDKGVLSLRGLITLMAFVMLALFGYLTYRACRICSGKRLFLSLFLAVSFCLNLFVFVFTTSTMVPRYYLTTFVFVLPVLCFYLEEEKLCLDRIVVGLLLGLCLLTASAKTVGSYLGADKNEAKRPVAQFLQEGKYSFGYASYWNANIITELTNGAVEIANIGDPEGLEFFKWSSPMKYYEDGYAAGEVFLLLTAQELAQYEDAPAVRAGEVIYQSADYTVLLYESQEALLQYARQTEN